MIQNSFIQCKTLLFTSIKKISCLTQPDRRQGTVLMRGGLSEGRRLPSTDVRREGGEPGVTDTEPRRRMYEMYFLLKNLPSLFEEILSGFISLLQTIHFLLPLAQGRCGDFRQSSNPGERPPLKHTYVHQSLLAASETLVCCLTYFWLQQRRRKTTHH